MAVLLCLHRNGNEQNENFKTSNHVFHNIILNDQSRRMRWAGHVARMGETRNAYRILVGNPEGKRPQGRPRRRWVDNIRIDLRDRMGWIGYIWLRIGTTGGLL
jgi:hypothetical protein